MLRYTAQPDPADIAGLSRISRSAILSQFAWLPLSRSITVLRPLSVVYALQHDQPFFIPTGLPKMRDEHDADDTARRPARI